MAFNSSKERMKHPEISTGDLILGGRDTRPFYDFLYNPNYTTGNLRISKPKKGNKYGRAPRLSLPRRSSSSDMTPNMFGDTKPNKQKPNQRNSRGVSISIPSEGTIGNADAKIITETSFVVRRPRENSSVFARRLSQTANNESSSSIRRKSSDSGIASEKSQRRQSSITNEDISFSFDNSRV